MKHGKSRVSLWVSSLVLSLVFFAGIARGDHGLGKLEVGQPAPDFTVTDSNGKTHQLSDYKGKYVVLEWLNHGCPFVRKHYDSGNMQKTQAEVTEQGAVWFSVVSSAPGKQGYMMPEEANAAVKENKAHPTAVLLDPEGHLGKKYGAKTTPHIFIVDPEGTLVYQGGMDDIRSTNQADIPKATNYVSAAFADISAKHAVKESDTAPYGCSIKYKD